MDPEQRQKIENLPSPQNIKEMARPELELTLRSIRLLWKEIANDSPPTEDSITAPESTRQLHGNFWLLPGGILVRGYNHFTAAKKHKTMFCNLLGINGWRFEHCLAGEPNKLVGLLIEHGAVRVNFDQKQSRALFQATSQSWPTARDKILRMVHRHRIVKVIDTSVPYRGWSSGVPVIVNNQEDLGV